MFHWAVSKKSPQVLWISAHSECHWLVQNNHSLHLVQVYHLITVTVDLQYIDHWYLVLICVVVEICHLTLWYQCNPTKSYESFFSQCPNTECSNCWVINNPRALQMNWSYSVIYDSEILLSAIKTETCGGVMLDSPVVHCKSSSAPVDSLQGCCPAHSPSSLCAMSDWCTIIPKKNDFSSLFSV